ncbi:MAG: aspartate aminotransferase family protein [Bacteroidetes bacterium]|nr:MAG: aspartate aminotransferase family protein [Bacteroidota bacterium]
MTNTDTTPYKYGPFLDLGLAATTPYPLNIKINSAEGVWLNCENRGRLFDAISGIGVSNFGHGHPYIKAALHEQIEKNLHTMVYGEFHHESTIEAASLLSSFLPDNLDTVYFVNSGTEAIEGALKLSKRITGRHRMIACIGGYHGNTAGSLSVSSNSERKAPFLPLLPEVSFITFNDIQSLSEIDDSISCVIIETIQGDAGVIVPSEAWMIKLREVCSKNGVTLIFDEIQCGMGRSGRPFAFTEYKVTPDILCVGKALGGGMPIGAFVSSRANMKLLSNNPVLGHITTFGGHPVTCAGAVAALKLLKDIDFVALERRCDMWEQKLSSHSSVKCVRRNGAFFAIELKDAETTSRVILKGLEIGVLMFWFLSVPSAFRLSPPLSMSDEEAEIGIAMILEALNVA